MPAEKTNRIPGMKRRLNGSQVSNQPYDCTVLGSRFVVLPGVFSPSYYSETAFFAQGVIDQIQKRVT